MSVWIDSGTPISIFTIGELRNILGTAGVKVNELKPEDNEFRDYGNNPLHLLRTDSPPESKRMGRRSKDQGARRQQTIYCWKGLDV